MEITQFKGKALCAFHDMTPQTSSTSTVKLGPGETKCMEATTPELGPVGLLSPKSSIFSGSDSNVGDGTYQVDSRA